MWPGTINAGVATLHQMVVRLATGEFSDSSPRCTSLLLQPSPVPPTAYWGLDVASAVRRDLGLVGLRARNRKRRSLRPRTPPALVVVRGDLVQTTVVLSSPRRWGWHPGS